MCMLRLLRSLPVIIMYFETILIELLLQYVMRNAKITLN